MVQPGEQQPQEGDLSAGTITFHQRHDGEPTPKEMVKFYLDKDTGKMSVSLGEGVTMDEASKSAVECFSRLFQERIKEIREEEYKRGLSEGRGDF